MFYYIISKIFFYDSVPVHVWSDSVDGGKQGVSSSVDSMARHKTNWTTTVGCEIQLKSGKALFGL